MPDRSIEAGAATELFIPAGSMAEGVAGDMIAASGFIVEPAECEIPIGSAKTDGAAGDWALVARLAVIA